MQITALGHSCILLGFDNEKTGEVTRILVDPWLSDHATGDAMGRFPRLRFAMRDLGPIHAVYLSHAHCDHLDPYTLVRLWSELDSPPVLLLPVSLSFLQPLFRTHLDTPDVRILKAHTVLPFRGLDLLGFYDVGSVPTNEDDVMVLVVTNASERVLVEADARLELELPNFRAYVTRLMRGRGITSAVYLTTENELTGTLESRTCETPDDRDAVAAYALDEMLQAVEQLYLPVQDPDDLWQGERVLRLVHGQGLTAPHELDPQWQRILFPVTVADRVQAERATAERNGCRHHIDSLTVGSVHTIVDGRIQSRKPMPGLELLDDDTQRVFDGQLPFFPQQACAPLRVDERDIDRQRTRILDLLNSRFLPHLHGLGDPPVLHLLASYGGTFRIRVHYGPVVDARAWDYVLGYDTRNFVEVAAAEGAPHEAYWGNDLEDVLDGRCDEFTPFCRQQLPAESMRLWVSLATPLLNSDLVFKRIGHHFERAKNGLTPGSYVLELYKRSAADPT
jgi:hypothetical protein